MRANCAGAAAVAALFALGGCNKASPPDKVASDVAKATAEAEKNNARSAKKAEEADAAIADDLDKNVDKANARAASAAADDAVTQAEGQNKIELARCQALAGDAQKACKDQANAELDLVKERAKALKSSGTL
ncbi:MAG TPA: hypothetical protein VHB68_06820 [Steroidobacteraceae bacterium]|nr:hypothetical protein [Steroidobacteraceae bacterium]